ncbi:hypothetical protein ACIGMX_09725 [Streptomyces aquilus]|uniref:hypothetical protein n=1 Tax=Streptomyces aquilus TaxID=2548456 RepID=UPI0037CD83D6
MAAAQAWKRPELAGQPELQKLNDELHDLRLDAGFPSARAIRDQIGVDAQGYSIVNHQAVLDIFQKPELPQLGRLELIVGALAENARRSDVASEIDRFKALWKQAVREAVMQASVKPPADETASDDDDGMGGVENASTSVPEGDAQASDGRTEDKQPSEAAASSQDDKAAAQFNYAQESLKGLIINAAQALWHDKDALRIFLGVVRRSEGFARMADALEERRPANATFYGIKSREFEVDRSVARLELVTLHRFLEEQRLKRNWSFTYMEAQTGIPSDEWIRWRSHDELPRREALIAFSHMAGLPLEDYVLLLGLWDAAYEVLKAQKAADELPSEISFAEAWAMRDQATPKMWALMGVGGDRLAVHGPDLTSGTAPAFVIAGPPKSGRSTALVNTALSLLAAGNRLVLAAPKPSPLRDLADRDGVVACFTQDDIKEDELKENLAGASPDEPMVLVMDDAEVLGDCEASRLLESLLRNGFDKGIALVLGGNEDEIAVGYRWPSKAKTAHRGLLLSPQKWNAGDLIGIRTGDTISTKRVTPGRGWLHLGDGKLLPVTVPH